MNYAYERVSTIKQDEKRQEMAFNNIKIDKRLIDKMSGKTKDRPNLNKLMAIVKPGDNVYIESISRLGRNVDDLRQLVEYFTEKKVIIHFIKEGFSTNGTTHKFLLTILGAVAEMEREMIVERVKEGIKKAQIYGTKSGREFGRPGLTLHKDFEKYYRQWQLKKITAIEFSKLLGIHRSSLYRHINFYRKNKLDLLQQPGKCLIKAKEINETKIKAIETKVYKDFDDDTVLWYMERLKVKLKEDISYSRLHKLFKAYGHEKIKWVYKNLDSLEVKGLDRYSNFLYHVRYSKKITQ